MSRNTDTTRAPSRRRLFQAGALALLAGTAAGVARSASPATSIEVWKDPNCGCCKDWIAHLQANGLEVVVHDTGNNAVRARLGVPMALASCHTGRIGGYAIEGHVPAREIQRLLRERPEGDRPERAGHAGRLAGHGRADVRRAPRSLRRGADRPRRLGQRLRQLPLNPRGPPMQILRSLLASAAVLLAATTALAQAMTTGEIRKVDLAGGRVTLNHGEIKNLDMPPNEQHGVQGAGPEAARHAETPATRSCSPPRSSAAATPSRRSASPDRA